MLALVALLPACSFAFVKELDGPAVRDARLPAECTISRSLPVTDAVIGAIIGGAVGATTYMTIEKWRDDEDCPNCMRGTGPALLAAFLMVSPWWISSAVGFSDTSACRRAHRARGMLP